MAFIPRSLSRFAQTLVPVQQRLIGGTKFYAKGNKEHMMMANYIGHWKVTHVEGFEAMKKAVGIKEQRAHIYKDMKFILEIKHNKGENWSFIVHMPQNRRRTYTFNVGKKFRANTLHGEPFECVVTIKDGKFFEKVVDTKNPAKVARRCVEILEDELYYTTVFEDTTLVIRHRKLITEKKMFCYY